MLEEGNITLKQGLERFYQEHISHFHHEKGEIPKEDKSFFKSHDIAHVVFGCDVSLYGEGSVKIWTVFGTTLGVWKHFRHYKDASAFELSKNFINRHLLENIFKLLFSIPALILRSKKMNKLWPWSEYGPYLDTHISEIRREFNIKVLK